MKSKQLIGLLLQLIDPETGKDVAKGETGEVCCRGPQVMKGYLKNKQATDDMIIDGWLHTGQGQLCLLYN